MSAQACPALLRARIQSGGVGRHPGIAGSSNRCWGEWPCRAGSLRTSGIAQRAGPAQGDELPSGPAPDGQRWAH